MLRNVVAIERDGIDVRVITILFEIPHQDFDLKAAVKAAATDYVKTPKGKELYDYNCSLLNWADFAWAVPNEFCEKHGFKKVETGILPDIAVNWDEDLVNDSQLESEED